MQKIYSCFLLITRWVADKSRQKEQKDAHRLDCAGRAAGQYDDDHTGYREKAERIWCRVGNSFKKRAESPIAKIGIRDNTTPVNMLLVRAMP